MELVEDINCRQIPSAVRERHRSVVDRFKYSLLDLNQADYSGLALYLGSLRLFLTNLSLVALKYLPMHL